VKPPSRRPVGRPTTRAHAPCDVISPFVLQVVEARGDVGDPEVTWVARKLLLETLDRLANAYYGLARCAPVWLLWYVGMNGTGVVHHVDYG
jgi:hypothetical protein